MAEQSEKKLKEAEKMVKKADKMYDLSSQINRIALLLS